MTEPQPRPGRVGSGRVAVVVASVGVLAVLVAIGLALSLGGTPTGTAPATAVSGTVATAPTGPAATIATGALTTPAWSELPLVAVTTAPSRPGASPAAPSPSPTPAAGVGIRASRIRIDRLGIDLAIIEGDGIDAPIGKAAHYPGSAWPGAGSNTYIYGHARKGMFLRLWEARVGDVIDLDLADGTSRAYVVTKVLPRVPWNALRYVGPTATEQLTLQTSTSYYPTAPRFVVIAVPAP